MTFLIVLLVLGAGVIFAALQGIFDLLKSIINSAGVRYHSKQWIDGYKQGQMDAANGIHCNY